MGLLTRAGFPAPALGSGALSHTQSHSVSIRSGRLAKARVAGSNPVSRSIVFSLKLPMRSETSTRGLEVVRIF
jgi:hypothetical protein